MSTLFIVQFVIVLLCILVGAQAGGIGLGVFGGLGLAVLTFGFQLQPTSPPIDVMLMIMAVVCAAAAMQAAGGLDLMIRLATRILRKNPKHITFIAPAVTYVFTIFAGTGHVAYSVLPVIAEVARRNGVRPERPLSMAVIASQFSIVASPIAAAVYLRWSFWSLTTSPCWMCSWSPYPPPFSALAWLAFSSTKWARNSRTTSITRNG